jgi:hypothetical protein
MPPDRRARAWRGGPTGRGADIHGVREESYIMMPYQSYQLYQAERTKTAAEIRRADEQLGHMARNLSLLWQHASRATSTHLSIRSSSDSHCSDSSSQRPFGLV